MKRILMRCLIALAVSGVPCVLAQTPPPKAKTLDSRSVIMSWTNEAPAEPSDEMPMAAKPAATDSNRAAAPAAAAPNAPPPPSPYDGQVQEATKMIQGGQAEEAIQSLLDVLAHEPKHRQARFQLGTAYIQMDRYRDAVDMLEPMTKEFPDDYYLKNNLSWLYATARDLSIRDGAKAVRLAQDALFIAPGDFHVWSTLSEAYYIAGQYSKAQRAAEEALRLATQSGVKGRGLDEYRQQVTKSQNAAEAGSVME